MQPRVSSMEIIVSTGEIVDIHHKWCCNVQQGGEQ